MRSSDATGYYPIPLTYGSGTAGTLRWRVGAVTSGGTVYSDEFDFARTAPLVSVSASSAGTKRVGALTYAWGRVSGYVEGRVFTQVLTPRGWSTSQVRSSDATGYYLIPLTYGASTAGTLRWRVGASTPGGTVYSEEFDFVRTMPPVSVSATTAGPTPVGGVTRASGRVDGFTGGRVFTQVLLSGGWSECADPNEWFVGFVPDPADLRGEHGGDARGGVSVPSPLAATCSATSSTSPARNHRRDNSTCPSTTARVRSPGRCSTCSLAMTLEQRSSPWVLRSTPAHRCCVGPSPRVTRSATTRGTTRRSEVSPRPGSAARSSVRRVRSRRQPAFARPACGPRMALPILARRLGQRRSA